MLCGLLLLSVGLMFGNAPASSVKADAEDCISCNSTSIPSQDPIYRLRPPVEPTLMESTTYGEWKDEYRLFNCYAFAINDYSKFYHIGELSGQDCVVNKVLLPILQLADMVYDDLLSLEYECIDVSCNTFTLPQNGQNLICVRASEALNDFHFMKYDDGAWYHKPGNTWVLKYNGTPTASIPWRSEGAVPGQILVSDDYYDSDIYFFNYKAEHGDTYCQYYNTSYHTVTCRDCMNGYTKPHNFVFKAGKRTCTGCHAIFNDDGYGSVILEDDDTQIA